jgi:membrane-bound lytic murein transglycosylase F
MCNSVAKINKNEGKAKFISYLCTRINEMKVKEKIIFIIVCFLLLVTAGCHQRQERLENPWGEEPAADEDFDLDDIERAGEMIALTISGPDTYYDYHGSLLGLHTMLCQQLADSLGVRLRIELCRDTLELMSKLQSGDGDLIAYPINKLSDRSPGWRISADKPLLAKTLADWYHPMRMEKARQDEQRLLSTGGSVRRKVFAPMLNKEGGIISRYDALFQQHCASIRWDWRLMAAQCYQESTFDPNALSWAGARGLMQIMPQTADHLGLPRSELSNPERNIAAAARYIAELEQTFADIPSRRERQDFVLAAYNGGPHHIRDAMALAQHDGRDNRQWAVVSEYVLKLSQPAYYQSAVVQHGYMRGSETVGYVQSIRQRYQQYRGVKASAPVGTTPQKSRNPKHRQKFNIQSQHSSSSSNSGS